MRARSAYQRWEPLLNRQLDWLTGLDPALDLIGASDEEWRAADGTSLATAALEATIGPGRGPAVATKVLHLKRPRLFPVLDDLVSVMLGVNMTDDAKQRVTKAVELLLHLRVQGRANIRQLRGIQTALTAGGINRPLVRIRDAIVWFSHPAAGVPNAVREITVSASSRH
jgi:hypothetical protein